MTALPLWPNTREIHCENNWLIKLPSLEGPVPGWPIIKFISCDIDKLRCVPYHIGNVYINGIYPNRKYHNRRLLFWHLVKINKENRKIKMSTRIHELKWRNVNAEIICRPNTGIEWHKYNNLINDK